MTHRRIMLTFALLSALFASGYGVMFTVLDDYRDQFGIPENQLGIVVAIGFFSSFLAQVFIAPLADKGHARLLVYLGLAFNVAGLLTMAFGTSIGILGVGRFVMGIGAGVAGPAIRRIVILADPDHLGDNIGRLLSADVAGFALGPAISAVMVGPFGLPSPFILIAVLSVACVPLVTGVHVQETAVEDQHESRFAFDMLNSRPFLGALAMGAAVFVMIGTFDSLWVLVLDDLNSPDWIANIGITIFALPLVFLGSVGGRLAQRVGPFRLGVVGLVIGATFMFLYGQMPTALAMFAISMFHALNDGLTISSTGVAIGMVSEPERQAAAQGLLGGVQTLVGGTTAVIAGSLYKNHGREVAYTSAALAVATLGIIGAVLAGKAWMRRPSVDNTATLEPVGQPA
jgi:MFS family permease